MLASFVLYISKFVSQLKNSNCWYILLGEASKEIKVEINKFQFVKNNFLILFFKNIYNEEANNVDVVYYKMNLEDRIRNIALLREKLSYYNALRLFTTFSNC